MNVSKEKSDKEITLTVTLDWDELKPYLEQAAATISRDVKVEGFRPGKVPYDIIKNKVGEMAVLQEAANIAVQKTADTALKNQIQPETDDVIGRPEVRVTKMAVNNEFEYKVALALAPVVSLGKYKDLGIKAEHVEVKDSEVEKVLTDLRNLRAWEKIVDREVREGDKVMVNIEMFLDSVPVEGGQSKNTAVLIGADYIIPGFDKQLLGIKKNETRDFKLPYPDNHYQKNLAGKLVEFRVSAQEVYERGLPELTDEFAKNLGVKDAADLKDKIRENLQTEMQQKNEQKVVVAIFEKILAKTTFSHLPHALVHGETHAMLRELKNNVEQQGGKFADYLLHLKKIEQELESELEPEAEKRVKTSFIVSQIVKNEGLEVTNEELQKKIDETLKAHDNNLEAAKQAPHRNGAGQAQTPEYRHYVKSNLMNQKVIAKLKEWNVK